MSSMQKVPLTYRFRSESGVTRPSDSKLRRRFCRHGAGHEDIGPGMEQTNKMDEALEATRCY